MYKLYRKAKKIFFIKKPFLAYRYNRNSLTSKLTKKNYEDMKRAFYSIKAQDNDIELKIFKIRIARGVSYFKNFLFIKDKNYINIIKVVKKFNLSLDILRVLKFPDFIFYKFRRIYEILDKIRFISKR